MEPRIITEVANGLLKYSVLSVLKRRNYHKHKFQGMACAGEEIYDLQNWLKIENLCVKRFYGEYTEFLDTIFLSVENLKSEHKNKPIDICLFYKVFTEVVSYKSQRDNDSGTVSLRHKMTGFGVVALALPFVQKEESNNGVVRFIYRGERRRANLNAFRSTEDVTNFLEISSILKS